MLVKEGERARGPLSMILPYSVPEITEVAVVGKERVFTCGLHFFLLGFTSVHNSRPRVIWWDGRQRWEEHGECR